MNNSLSHRLSLSARLTLVAALLFLLGSVAQIAYRFTLPTDGWAVLTEEITGSNWLLYSNLVGAASELRANDTVLAVDGVSVQGTATTAAVPAPAGWQVGRTVTMLVQRDDEPIEVAVPVVHWTAMALVRYNVLEPVKLAAISGALLFVAVGWFTFLRRPDVPSAHALLLLSAAVGGSSISGLLPDGLSVQFDQRAYWPTAFYSYIIFGTVLAPSLLTFTLLFPRPKRVIERRAWLVLLPFAFGAFLLLFLVLGGPAEVGWLSTMSMFALSIASLVHAWLTQRDAVSRAQLRWAISSFVAGLGLFMLNFPLAFNWVTQPALVTLLLVAQSFAFAVIGTGLAVAVLRYRLFDIDVIIRRTLVYAVLTGLLALVYFGSVVLLQGVFEAVTGQQSAVSIVISTLIIAALFGSLRRRVQAMIDRRFFRKKYDAQQVLARFSQICRDEVSLEALTAEIINVAQETLQPETVALWLKDPISRND